MALLGLISFILGGVLMYSSATGLPVAVIMQSIFMNQVNCQTIVNAMKSNPRSAVPMTMWLITRYEKTTALALAMQAKNMPEANKAKSRAEGFRQCLLAVAVELGRPVNVPAVSGSQ